MTAATKVPLRRALSAAHTSERMIRLARFLVVGVVLVAVSPAAAVAKDGGDEVRAVRACGTGDREAEGKTSDAASRFASKSTTADAVSRGASRSCTSAGRLEGHGEDDA